MLVMGVVCAPWSFGTEKRPFDFGFGGGRTCVPEERTEERTKERTWDWRERAPRFIAPEGCGALSSPPTDAERVSSAPFGTGWPEWPFSPGMSPGPLIALYNECTVGGESEVREWGNSECKRSVWRRRGEWRARFMEPVRGGGRKPEAATSPSLDERGDSN